MKAWMFIICFEMKYDCSESFRRRHKQMALFLFGEAQTETTYSNEFLQTITITTHTCLGGLDEDGNVHVFAKGFIFLFFGL